MADLDSLPIAEKVAFRRNSVRVMRDLLALSTLMIQAEEYERGKDLFFVPSRKIWFLFGGTIKRLSPDLGESIESRFNSINTMLDRSIPSNTTLVAGLKELNSFLDQAVEISDEKL
ncbi:MAG: hypothetical protein QNJ37_05165 [Crocosphaera sp.]|nr:hypothetical protein [Crocosphaera sp.]